MPSKQFQSHSNLFTAGIGLPKLPLGNATIASFAKANPCVGARQQHIRQPLELFAKCLASTGERHAAALQHCVNCRGTMRQALCNDRAACCAAAACCVDSLQLVVIVEQTRAIAVEGARGGVCGGGFAVDTAGVSRC